MTVKDGDRWIPLKSHPKPEGQWVVHNVWTDQEKTFNYKTKREAQSVADRLNRS